MAPSTLRPPSRCPSSSCAATTGGPSAHPPGSSTEVPLRLATTPDTKGCQHKQGPRAHEAAMLCFCSSKNRQPVSRSLVSRYGLASFRFRVHKWTDLQTHETVSACRLAWTGGSRIRSSCTFYFSGRVCLGGRYILQVEPSGRKKPPVAPCTIPCTLQETA